MDKINPLTPLELPSKKEASEFARDQFCDIVSCEKDWEKRGLLKHFNKKMMKELREFGKLFVREDFAILNNLKNGDDFSVAALKIIVRIRLHPPYFCEVNGVKTYSFFVNDKVAVLIRD